MPTTRLALRTYARYVVPLTVLAAIALVPWWLIAVRARPPSDVAQARAIVRLAWLLAGTAWIGQLVLVGAAAPLARSLDAGAPLSQLRALGAGARQLARGLVPWIAAVAAIAISGLALVVPGLVMLVLLALTSASAAPGMPGPLVDSIAVARRRFARVAAVVVATIALDLVIAATAQRLALPPATARGAAVAAAAYVQLVRWVGVAVVLAAPLAAAALAAIDTRARAAISAD